MGISDQSHSDPHDLDAPKPPGGPQRTDAPAGDTTPGGPGTPAMPGTPEPSDPDTAHPVVEPSSTPDGPQTIPAQEENAETSQGEPSDASGNE